MSQSQNGEPLSVVARQFSNYRVMLLRANGQVALIHMCPSRQRAVRIARDACNKHLKRLESNWQWIIQCDDRPKVIYIEAWRGTATQGFWQSAIRGEFRFEFHDRPRGRRKRAEPSDSRRWKTGSVVDCVLLHQKTRKGGWRAKIVGASHQGPVTNWQALPAGITAGAKVRLKLCGISIVSGNAQFAVPVTDD